MLDCQGIPVPNRTKKPRIWVSLVAAPSLYCGGPNLPQNSDLSQSRGSSSLCCGDPTPTQPQIWVNLVDAASLCCGGPQPKTRIWANLVAAPSFVVGDPKPPPPKKTSRIWVNLMAAPSLCCGVRAHGPHLGSGPRDPLSPDTSPWPRTCLKND